MSLSLELPEQDRPYFIILTALYLFTRLPMMVFMPLIRDEALYAIMIEEQVRNPTLIPTLFGYAVSWKPPIFFWVYSVLTQIPLPIEIAFRWPSLIFGLATIFILFRIMTKIGASRVLAFFSLVAFIFSFVTIYPNATLLTDSLAFLFISSSVLLYTEKDLGGKRFIAAAALAFLAFFTKLVIAFMIPILALAFMYFHSRKELKSPLFILSLLALPLAFILHFLLLENVGLGSELYVGDIGGHVVTGQGLLSQVKQVWGSMHMLISGAGIWFALSIFGIWRFWREQPFMAVWYVMVLFPILTGYFMPWYYLPVFPAVSFFAVMALLKWEGPEKADRFFVLVLAMLLMGSIIMISMLGSNLYYGYIDEKEAGLVLAGKENSMVLGNYASGILAYKTITETRTFGEPLDFGWIVGVSCDFNGEDITRFAADYHSDHYPVTDGSFTQLFTTNDAFRKDTDITDFDYIAIVKKSNYTVPGRVIYDKTNVTVYEVDK